tara:strand:+ start:115 stop:315 length:201 start_codon:yes stop_codon:yes gene_type:complete
MTNNKQIDILWKAVNKQARYIEQLEIIIAHLKKDSHPPKHNDFDERLKVVEAWIDNIELIDKGELN